MGLLKINDSVMHNKYGQGVVVNITEDKIYVDFNGMTRIFPYPEALVKKYLWANVTIPKTPVQLAPVSGTCPGPAGRHTSELRQIFSTEDAFKKTYSSFLEQADKNAASGKANGGKTPYGVSVTKCDGGALTTHYGQGGAGKTPYLNWHVVSIYYIVDEKRIVLGIERDRYPHIDQMRPLRNELFKNRKNDVAVFYECNRDAVDYPELYTKFIEVSEEVMRLGI